MRLVLVLLLGLGACDGGCGDPPKASEPQGEGQTVSGGGPRGGGGEVQMALRKRADAAFTSAVKTVLPAQFEKEVVKSPLPVLVLYEGTACDACKAVQAALAELAPRYAGKVSFARVDVARASLPKGLSAKPLPAFAFYQGGYPLNVRQGVPKSPAVKDWLRKVIDGRDVRL